MTEVPITVFCCANSGQALNPPVGKAIAQPGVTVTEIPCSGRIDEVTILRALREGAGAEMVVGCLEGNCKFVSGNYQAWRRVEEVRSILKQLDINPDRVMMLNVASNQHARLARALAELKERASRWGPIRILEGDR
jgi:coenzyme F420-reducing hydrogenase delta subunit